MTLRSIDGGYPPLHLNLQVARLNMLVDAVGRTFRPFLYMLVRRQPPAARYSGITRDTRPADHPLTALIRDVSLDPVFGGRHLVIHCDRSLFSNALIRAHFQTADFVQHRSSKEMSAAETSLYRLFKEFPRIIGLRPMPSETQQKGTFTLRELRCLLRNHWFR